MICINTRTPYPGPPHNFDVLHTLMCPSPHFLFHPMVLLKSELLIGSYESRGLLWRMNKGSVEEDFR